MQMLHVHAEGSSHTDGSSHTESYESLNGITPAMRNARKRHFNHVNVPAQDVLSAEDDLLQIVQVHLSKVVYAAALHHCLILCRFMYLY